MPKSIIIQYVVLLMVWLLISTGLAYSLGAPAALYIVLFIFSTTSFLYLYNIGKRLHHGSLAASETIRKLNTALDAGRESVWEWLLADNSTEIIFSESYCSMLGYSQQEFATNQKEWQHYLHPDERERITKKVMHFIADRNPAYYGNTYRILHADGDYRWIHSRAKLAFNARGQVVSLIGMATDVTCKREDHDRLMQANAVFEDTHEGVLISDHNNNITFVNPAFTRITGYDVQEVLGKNPRMFQSGRHSKEFYHEMWRSLYEQDTWTGEIWNRRKNGEILPQFQSIRLIRDENNLVTYQVAIFSDISLLKRSESQLSYLAHYDPLTGLSNRLLLHEHIKLSLHRAIKNKTQAFLFMINLDHFKNINESLGHKLGDVVIKAAAERLVQFTDSNTTLSHLGGDEFAVVLDNLDSTAAATTFAQQLLNLFNPAFTVDGNEIFISASVGICLLPHFGDCAEEIFRNADTALSKAKATGRATFAFYTNELTEQAYQRLRVANELRYAVDNEQLRVVYQPVYSLKHERFIGCEALVRWQHPERGLLTPLEFIPIAEESGLINSIDTWVLNHSCQQMQNWLDAGIALDFIAINVSSKLFNHNDFTETVVAALNKSGLAAHHLELEITESAVMENQEHADQQLHSLQKMNVHLALDDFGTGYSSLSRLRSLPVNKLKIDQSFVSSLPDDVEDVAIIRAIIGLSASMQLEIQAEGIETAEQAAFFRQTSCNLAQGYFYSRPVPADTLLELLTSTPA